MRSRILVFCLLGFGIAGKLPAQGESVQGAAIKRSLERSRALYPESARAGSPLSNAILARTQWLGENDPEYFTDPDWPLKVTATEARVLGISPQTQTRKPYRPPGATRASPPRSQRVLGMVTENFSVTGASFRKGQQIILESLQDYGKRGTTIVDGQPILIWLDRIKLIRELPPGEPNPVLVKVVSARYGPPGRAGYSVSSMIQSLIHPTPGGKYEVLVSDALLSPSAARTLNRSRSAQPAFDPQTGQPNPGAKKILTVTYTIDGIPRTKQALEGDILVLD